MATKVGINGFGRIGRVFLHVLGGRQHDIDVCAINVHDADLDRLAYLFKYDSVFGRFQGEVSHNDKALIINKKKIKILSYENPDEIPWADNGVEYVLESTGKFTSTEDCEKHFVGGAKKVLLSAPSKDAVMPTFVYGVNHNDYTADMKVISNASCTTNCLAPLVKVISDNFGIERAFMSTIHSATSKQKAIDTNSKKDWRIGRSVFNNIIPTTTGAAKAVGRVIPEMNGKITGMAYRVPSNDVSVCDLTCVLNTPTDYKKLCSVVKKASETSMQGIIEYNTEDLVSADVRGDFCTCVFDVKAGMMLDDTFVKLIAWYDNEWGYSNQLVNMLEHMANVDDAAK